MVTKAKKALLASLAAFLCVMLTVFGLSMSVSLSETAKAADGTSDVAQVGITTYGTLNEAIGAAAEGDTVTLLKDTTEDVEVNKNITLDLGGKTLTGAKTAQKEKASLTVVKDVTATVKNGTILGTDSYYTIQNNGTATFETLTATAGNTDSSMIDNWGTLTINSGTYFGGLNVVKSEEDSKLTINGGKFTLAHSVNGYTGVIFTYGDTTITGGEFIQSTTPGRWNHPQVVLTGVVEGYTAITRVTGGSFTNNSKSSLDGIFHGYGKNATSDNFEVSGGTFNKSISEGYCAEGFIPSTTKNADGMYGVKEGKYVAKVGSTKYETLADAIRKAANGKTVTLLADIDLDEQIATGKAITIDGQGKYTIKATKKLVGTNDKAGMFYRTTSAQGTLTFLNVTLDGNGVSKIFLNEGGAGETVFDGVTSINGGGIAYGSGIHISGGGSHATIKNSTLTGSTGTTELTKENYYAANDLWVGGNVYVIVENSTIGNVFVNSAPSATATNGVVHGQLTITGENTKITYLSGEEESAEKVDKFGNNGSLVKIDSGSVDTIFDMGSYAISGGTFKTEIKPEYCADGFVATKNTDGTFGVKEGTYVAEVKGVKYETLQAAIKAASQKATVKLLADTRENVTIEKALTLDLNGYTINGGTEKGKPAVTVKARVTIKDSSAKMTGTIKREDTAGNSGVSSHYVIDVQDGWLTFEGGNVINDSGNDKGNGASLVRVGNDSVNKYPGLTIKGGTFTQDNFIVIKIDRGDLFLNGGTLNSKKSYAIENWHRATVKGGTVNGVVAAWAYSGGANSELEISGGTINGNVTSVNYDNTTDKKAKVSITGGTVTGTLSAKVYGESTETDDTAKATIEVSGGTFNEDPAKYIVEGSATITKNADGTYGVEKAYLAKVGDTSYYTMDEAFKAQTKSGEEIVMLRDYTTGSTFNSGSIHRVVDLNGHTWTYTGTDKNSAAFEINYSNATLTVKNGKIISTTLVGLIPSAMGGTIKYDNAGLVFEGVEMTSNGGSGIETNGNNTNDSVTLINSTLDVPNGFGIYFPSSGTLTIDNSKINAKTMGVQVCSGKLNINAGSAITVTGDAVHKAENDGAIQDGAAISIVNRSGYKGLSDIVITGGTFTAKVGNNAIKAYDWADKGESEFTRADLVAVKGGTFSSEVEKDYLADGFVVNKNTNGTYGVTEGSGFAGACVVVTESLAMKVVVGTASKYVVVTYKGLDGIAKTVRLDKFTDIEGKDYKYCLFDQIMPQMIDVKFSFELYGENDVMLDRKANYSVVDYLAGIIASDKDSAEFRNVAASLIEYANRAKDVKGLTTTVAPKFVDKDGNPVTLDYDAFVEAHKIPAKDTVGEISQGDGKVIYKARVVFDDAYTLTFYTNDNEKQYTYKLDNKDIVFDENGEYTVNVLAQNITTKYVLTVYDKDSNLVQTVTYGVSTYCIRMQGTETPQGELYVASYYYGVAVNQYGTANPNSVQG